MTDHTTVGRYLVERLKQIGVNHVFGVPGDYVLTFMDRILEGGVELVGTCNELNAAYAADAYARVNGIGAVCVTYGVGSFSALNGVAGAFAEQVPLIMISGSPRTDMRHPSMLLHHSLGDLGVLSKVYENVTVVTTALSDPAEAPDQIDAALRACLTEKRPVALEIPVDMVDQPCRAPGAFDYPEPMASDPDALAEVLDEILELLGAAKQPVILAGIELHRFGLLESFDALVEKSGLPVASTLLGKTVISELHPQAIGVYEGAISRSEVREVVEEADLLLCLGAWMSDINLGVYTARLDDQRMVTANSGRVRVRHHVYDPIALGDLVSGLTERWPADGVSRGPFVPASQALDHSITVRPDDNISVKRLFSRINQLISDTSIVIADAGDALFSASDLVMHRDVGFLGQAFYLSIGFTLPATLGAQMAAPDRRVMTFIGDGAFQMTVQELSTIIRKELNPIIFVLNNNGYTAERMIHEGPYNDIQGWQNHRLPEVFGGGWGVRVGTEDELEAALEKALACTGGPALIEVMLDQLDVSDQLKRLGAELAPKGADDRD